MKNYCAITATIEDSDKFVRFLIGEASSEFEIVNVLALGKEDDVEILKARFDDVISLNDIKPSFAANRVIVTSLDAFYELDNYALRFDDITFWLDPSLEGASSESELVDCISANTLASQMPRAIAAVTKDGVKKWANYSSIAVPSVHREISCMYELDKIEPLIEKCEKVRILIDGSSNVSNHYMVDAFITLQKIENVEIWCHFDGELKNWMRPDLLISGVSREDIAIYVDSVDAVVLVGDQIQTSQFIDYIQLRKLPIAIDDKVKEQLDEYISSENISDVCVQHGMSSSLEMMAINRTLIEEYNQLALTVDLSKHIFKFVNIENLRDSASKLESYYRAPLSSFVRQEYLLSRYGNIEGSEFHKNLKMNGSVVGEFKPFCQQKIRVSGWAFNTQTDELCIPIVFTEKRQLSGLIRRHKRADVLEYFEKDSIENVGFVAKYYCSDVDFDKEKIIYAIGDGVTGYVAANTILENLDTSVDDSYFEEMGFTLAGENGLNGCIETLSFQKILTFDLTGLTESYEEYEFRLKRKNDILDLDSVDISFVVDDEIRNKDIKINKSSFKFISTVGCQKSVSIIADFGFDSIDPADYLCVVSHKFVDRNLEFCTLNSNISNFPNVDITQREGVTEMDERCNSSEVEKGKVA